MSEGNGMLPETKEPPALQPKESAEAPSLHIELHGLRPRFGSDPQ